MRTHLLPSTLLALLLDWTGTYSHFVQAQTSDTSFLSDTLIRKDQVQKVLEYEPAEQATCETTVSPILPELLPPFKLIDLAHYPAIPP
ncbi:hypothetical protein EW146_g205 [Bondarzewia mesenterica]|uniref:Uncharacterized protein n=1 Tax=Bondarzewia mesenterica TaxID=1095465 RepID=A0A4V3XGG5_9AGAM|nr:hypothetical protein EW146_g205 [Bondarzewia mesenterica]